MVPPVGSTPPAFNDIPRARAPKSLPDPFLDDAPPPAAPVPTETRLGKPQSRHAATNRVTNQFFAAQIRAGKETAQPQPTPAGAPIVEARSVLKATHQQSAPTAESAKAVAPAVLVSPVESRAETVSNTAVTVSEAAPTLIIPVNPLR